MTIIRTIPSTRLRPEKVMEKEALIAENLNKQMKFRAMPRQIYVI